MVRVTATYTGKKHCVAEHEPSSRNLETDAPKDNQGLGESFSPTDLVATALGTCALTTMAIYAEQNGLNLNGSKMSVEKIMTSNPRKIASLKTVIHLPKDLEPSVKQKLEEIAHSCPVKKSLHPEIQIPIEFIYSI